MASNKPLFLGLAVAALVWLSGCTRYDPYTGQQQIDPAATAGVAGLALGAAALGVAASNNNDRDVVVVNPGHPYYRPYPPGYGGGYRPPRPQPYPNYRPGYRPPHHHRPPTVHPPRPYPNHRPGPRPVYRPR